MAQVWGIKAPHTTKLVLQALADHADDDGNRVYPSVDYIAWKTDLSSRQVQRIMKGLRGLGALVLVRRARQHSPAEYRLSLDAMPLKVPYTRVAVRGDMVSPLLGGREGAAAAEVTSDTSRGDIHDIRGDIAVSPKPSVEPSTTEPPSTEPEKRFGLSRLKITAIPTGGITLSFAEQYAKRILPRLGVPPERWSHWVRQFKDVPEGAVVNSVEEMERALERDVGRQEIRNPEGYFSQIFSRHSAFQMSPAEEALT